MGPESGSDSESGLGKKWNCSRLWQKITTKKCVPLINTTKNRVTPTLPVQKK